MRDLLLGIDVGTTSAKAALVMPDGCVMASANATYPTHYPCPGWVEQEPRDWWDAACRAVRLVLDQVSRARERVAAIGASGQGCAVTLLDAHGDVIRPAIIWMDSRAEPQAARLRAVHGARIAARNGKTTAPYNADPVLMWLAQHEPQQLKRARCSLTTTGYLNFRLSGETVMNASDASILFAYDLHTDAWAIDLIRAFGLPARLYPRLSEGHCVIGALTPHAARDLDLPPGVPIVAGGEDTSSAALAAGAVHPGQALLSLGTAGTVNVVQAVPTVVPHLLTFRHVLPERWMVGGSTVAVGAALEWAKRSLAPDVQSYDMFTHLAAQAPPGSNGVLFLPYLNGELQPINDGHARGAFVGLRFTHDRAHLARAVMEGAAFALTHNLKLLGARANSLELRAVGGPTKSVLWCQILADVTAQPLSVLRGGGAPVGNALLAGRGAGLVDDPSRVASVSARVERTFEPRSTEVALYARLFEVYESLYPQLQSAFVTLAALPTSEVLA